MKRAMKRAMLRNACMVPRRGSVDRRDALARLLAAGVLAPMTLAGTKTGNRQAA